MPQTLVPNGIPLNFGFVSNDNSNKGLADNGAILSGYLLQSADYETGADKEDVRALQGDIVGRNWYDIHTKGNIRLFITGTGRANARANTSLSQFVPGVILNITKCDSHPDLVGTNWEIQASAKIAGDITKSAELTIPVEKRAGITTSQPA